jgi:hypothetical protein
VALAACCCLQEVLVLLSPGRVQPWLLVLLQVLLLMA